MGNRGKTRPLNKDYNHFSHSMGVCLFVYFYLFIFLLFWLFILFNLYFSRGGGSLAFPTPPLTSEDVWENFPTLPLTSEEERNFPMTLTCYRLQLQVHSHLKREFCYF